MKGISITSHRIVTNGVTRYRFVVNGKRFSGRTWASARSAIAAGKREYRIK